MDDSENLTPGREEISSYKTFDNLVTSSARTNAIRSCRPISDDTNLTSFIFERALATESFARVSTSNPTKAREGFSCD